MKKMSLLIITLIFSFSPRIVSSGVPESDGVNQFFLLAATLSAGTFLGWKMASRSCDKQLTQKNQELKELQGKTCSQKLMGMAKNVAKNSSISNFDN